MTDIQWGLAQGGGAQNALAQGFQLGAVVKKQREEAAYKNALAGFDPNNPDTLQPIMAVRPEVGLQLRQDVQARQLERQTADLTQRAIGGDAEALSQLASVNFDRWKSLDATQKAEAKQEAEIFGNAAMDILNRPPEQRPAAMQAYAQQLGQQYPEVAQLLELPPNQQEMALRSAVAEAGMVGKLIEMEQPRYQVIPAGGDLVDTRNPQAVQQFAQGGGAGPQAPIPSAAADALRRGEGTAEQFDQMFGPGAAQRILGNGGAGAERVGSNFLDGL